MTIFPLAFSVLNSCRNWTFSFPGGAIGNIVRCDNSNAIFFALLWELSLCFLLNFTHMWCYICIDSLFKTIIFIYLGLSWPILWCTLKHICNMFHCLGDVCSLCQVVCAKWVLNRKPCTHQGTVLLKHLQKCSSNLNLISITTDCPNKWKQRSILSEQSSWLLSCVLLGFRFNSSPEWFYSMKCFSKMAQNLWTQMLHFVWRTSVWYCSSLYMQPCNVCT